MFVRTTPITDERWLSCYERYMCNRTHRRHFGYIVDDRCYYGIPDTMQDRTVVAEWIRIKQRRDERSTPGPKSKRLVLAIVMNTPELPVPEARLVSSERQFICDRVHQSMGGSMIAQAHIGPAGHTDIHFLSDREWTRKETPHVIIRQLFDQIHDELNALRQQAGRPLLPTMANVKQQRKREKGIIELSEQLAGLGPVDDGNLEEALTSLGHRLGPRGITDTTVQVIHAGKKRAYSYGKAKLLAGQARASAETTTDPRPSTAASTHLPNADAPATSRAAVADQSDPEVERHYEPTVFLRKIAVLGYKLGPDGVDEARDRVELVHEGIRDRKPREVPERVRPRPYTLRPALRPLVQPTQECVLSLLIEDLERVPIPASERERQPLGQDLRAEPQVESPDTVAAPPVEPEAEPERDQDMDV